jgi:hypothetical protein
MDGKWRLGQQPGECNVNVEQRTRILNATDRLAAASIMSALLGATVGFGGSAWWSGLLVTGSAFALVVATLIRLAFAGRLRILKSPLTALGLLALAIGVVQLFPLPPRLAAKLSPRAREVYGHGFSPALARADDPAVVVPDPAMMRSPASLDRAATLRSLVGATACLALFWGVSHYTDRMQRLYLVWGCVIAAFLLNATLATVQFSTRSDGLFGTMIPGSSSWWAPSADDLLNAPGSSVLRDLKDPAAANFAGAEPRGPAWVVETPTRPHLVGTMMGGPGAFLALGSLALPLALAMLLHLVAPRGSRERIGDRLNESGHGGLAVLLALMLAAGSVLVGLAAGPRFGLTFAVGFAVVGLPCFAIPGARGPAIGLTTLMLSLLGLGIGLGEVWPTVLGGSRPVAPPSWELAKGLWSDGLAIFRDFPMIGAGMGSFRTIHPYYKTQDSNVTTAMSSLIQWCAETGIAGLSVLAIGVLWCAWRLSPSLKRVGSADRCLAYGLIGAALGFTLLSVVHWTIELTAVAVSASALGGTWNRWLAGGTDLFVERG